MIVDSMSQLEIKKYLYNNVPESEKIIKFFKSNLRRQALKSSLSYVFNTIYKCKIHNITFYSVFYNINKKHWGSMLFATFFYRNSIRVVSLNPDNGTLHWYSSHYRERAVERINNSDYSLINFFKTQTSISIASDHQVIDTNSTCFVHKDYLFVIDASIEGILFYKTCIPAERDTYVCKHLIKSYLNSIKQTT